MLVGRNKLSLFSRVMLIGSDRVAVTVWCGFMGIERRHMHKFFGV